MRLDAAAQVALNMFPTPQDTEKTMSLAGLLNRTRTAMGGRRLLQWLRLPLLDRSAINDRLDVVQVLTDHGSMLAGLREALRGVGDIDRLIRKLQKQTATLEDVVALYLLASRLPALVSALETGAERATADAAAAAGIDAAGAAAAAALVNKVATRYLEPLKEGQTLVMPYEELVKTTVDLAAAARYAYCA